MGGSGGMFGSSKQKSSKSFRLTGEAKVGEAESLQLMRAIASGKSPSIGQQYMDQFNEQAAQQAMALAASQRGASNPMLAFRQAQMANQQMGLQNSQQAAIMGQQERMQANQAILGQAAAQRGVALQSAMANQNADAAKSQREASMVAGLGGAAMMASDENAKTNIKDSSDVSGEIVKMLAKLKPSEYEYKDAKHGTGEKVGIMAQDLEKSKVGKTMVDQAPDGTKMVDTNKAIGALLAAAAEMNKKIEKLEKKG